jgi:hypothetical protein
MPQRYDMGQTALLPLRRKACRGIFFRHKNRTASAGVFLFDFTSHLLHKTKQYIHVGVVKSERSLLKEETQQKHAFSCQILLPKPPNTLHAQSGEETCSKSLIQYAEVISHQFPPSRLCIKFPPCPLQRLRPGSNPRSLVPEASMPTEAAK